MEKSGTISSFLCVDRLNGVEANALQANRFRIPVAWVLGHLDHGIDLMAGQREGTIADEMARFGPCGSDFLVGPETFNSGWVYWIPGIMV